MKEIQTVWEKEMKLRVSEGKEIRDKGGDVVEIQKQNGRSKEVECT